MATPRSQQETDAENPVVVQGAAAQNQESLAYGATGYNIADSPDESPQKFNTLFGIQTHDAEMASLTNRVLTLALVALAVQLLGLLCFLFGPETKAYMQASGFATSGLGILIPICGYVGVRSNSRNWTCCFCGWSWLIAIGDTLTLCLLIGALANDKDVAAEAAKRKGLVALIILCKLLSVSLSGLSVFYGTRLYNKFSRTVVINNPVVLMQNTQPQPGYMA